MPLLSKRTTVTPSADYQPTLQIDKPLQRGDGGELVSLIQEWLCLNLCDVAIDGDYGYATEQAVKDFQGATGVLPVTGLVDAETFGQLVRPMIEALRPITPTEGATIGQMIAACALQHLKQHAREVGGQNRGPWVRLYLKGTQRPRDPKLPPGFEAWCAGFATTIIGQAAASMKRALPIDYHTNCNKLAAEAQREGRFLRGEEAKPERIPTGSLMLIRKSGKRDHWHHTGVVTQALSRFVRTIEGNSAYSTDDEPSGHEVCRQLRAYGNLDFIVIE